MTSYRIQLLMTNPKMEGNHWSAHLIHLNETVLSVRDQTAHGALMKIAHYIKEQNEPKVED